MSIGAAAVTVLGGVFTIVGIYYQNREKQRDELIATSNYNALKQVNSELKTQLDIFSQESRLKNDKIIELQDKLQVSNEEINEKSNSIIDSNRSLASAQEKLIASQEKNENLQQELYNQAIEGGVRPVFMQTGNERGGGNYTFMLSNPSKYPISDVKVVVLDFSYPDHANQSITGSDTRTFREIPIGTMSPYESNKIIERVNLGQVKGVNHNQIFFRGNLIYRVHCKNGMDEYKVEWAFTDRRYFIEKILKNEENIYR